MSAVQRPNNIIDEACSITVQVMRFANPQSERARRWSMPRLTRGLALFFLLLPVLACSLHGCGGGSSRRSGATTAGATSGTTGTTTTSVSTPAVAAVTSLRVAGTAALVSGNVAVAYRVTDAASAPADIDVRFSTNGGATWTATTDGPGGAGRSGLATGPGLGVEHIYVWNSAADLPQFQPQVLLRAEVVGGGGLTSPPLAVDNQPLTTAVALTRQPYLQSTTRDSVIVAWHTDQPTSGEVQFGETPALGQVALGFPNSTEQAARLTGLRVGTSYYYRLSLAGQPLTQRFTLETAPSTQQADVTFLVFGDSGSGSQEQLDLGQRMAREDAEFVLHTGDIIYTHHGGAARPVGDYNDYFFLQYQDLLTTRPIFPVAGNHDRGDITALFQPFKMAYHLPGNGSGTFDELYYSFEWGDAKFIMLETTITAYLPVGHFRTWFSHELLSNQRRWLIVVFHHPLYGSEGGSNILRYVIGPMLENNGVDLVLNGHDHAYERTVPIKQFNNSPNYPGLVHLITGGGGASLDPPNVPNAQSAAYGSAYHYLKMRIRGDQLFGEAIDLQGRVIDSFTVQNQ